MYRLFGNTENTMGDDYARLVIDVMLSKTRLNNELLSIEESLRNVSISKFANRLEVHDFIFACISILKDNV